MQQRTKARHAAGEAGLTLMELLVALVILAVIMGPLTLAFMTSVQVTEETGTQYRASFSRSQLASQFTRDVQGVDATGVSTNRGCRTSTQPASDTLLVSLNSTVLDASQPNGLSTTRASYWVSGEGVGISLVRRVCTNTTFGTEANNGTESMVAQRMGRHGLTATAADHLSIFHGPTTGSDIRRNPCDELSCTIEVTGLATFQTTAQRRVFGAGVPLEVNRLYSSSATSATDTPNLLQHLAPNGTSLGVEHFWNDAIRLAPGLDGSDKLTVKFKVEQRFSNGGASLPDPNHARYWNGTSWVADPDTWADGSYNATTAVWSLPLTRSQFSRGGEYRIWTQLVPEGEPAKIYGGADAERGGFPLWVDWDPSRTVFVTSTGANGGDDTNDGLSAARPVATLARAFQVARANPERTEILLANVTHTAPAAAITTATAGNTKSIIGSFGAGPIASASWKRSPVGTYSQIAGASGTGLVMNGPTGQRFRQVDFRSGTPVGAGASAYGMKVLGGSVTLERSRVVASNGNPGTNGTNGANGKVGCRGVAGNGRTGGSNTNWVGYSVTAEAAPCLDSSSTDRRKGGAGGARNGGAGGNGGTSYSDPAAVGGSGGGTSCSPGVGAAGRGGEGGTSFTSPVPGAAGKGGGASGGPSGVMAEGWTGANGETGRKGVDGRGGGGSGAGGRNSCLFTDGAQGASGGQGGTGGEGGTGGTAGGGSFGIWIHNAGSVTLDNFTTVAAGNGGNGGTGGKGGNGGAGGQGGGANNLSVGGNSKGAGGGAGGQGGGAGGGGQGGPSIGVVRTSASAQLVMNAAFKANISDGVQGAGGASGAPNVGDRAVGGAAGAGGETASGCLLNFFGWCVISNNTAGGADGTNGPPGASPDGSAGSDAGGTLFTLGSGQRCRIWAVTGCDQ